MILKIQRITISHLHIQEGEPWINYVAKNICYPEQIKKRKQAYGIREKALIDKTG